MDKPENVTFSGGAVSSPCPPFECIPRSAQIALANRFARGKRLKGDGAWNALSKNFNESAEDKAFVLNRLGHAIDHCYKAISRINGILPELDAEDTADGGDAGAIMFAGALLAEYKARGK
jgi:hypothetical protein